MGRQSAGSPYSRSAIVASVSPSATVYVPPAAGDGLGEGLGDGEGGTDGGNRPGAGLGDGVATGELAGGVGVGVPPPIQPQAVISTVPTSCPWTIQRGFGRSKCLSMMVLPYGSDLACATVFTPIDAES